MNLTLSIAAGIIIAYWSIYTGLPKYRRWFRRQSQRFAFSAGQWVRSYHDGKAGKKYSPSEFPSFDVFHIGMIQEGIVSEDFFKIQRSLSSEVDLNSPAVALTPLGAAVIFDQKNIVPLLLAKGANPNLVFVDVNHPETGQSPLSAAVSNFIEGRKNALAILEVLLSSGANPDFKVKTKNGFESAYEIAKKNKSEVLLGILDEWRIKQSKAA